MGSAWTTQHDRTRSWRNGCVGLLASLLCLTACANSGERTVADSVSTMRDLRVGDAQELTALDAITGSDSITHIAWDQRIIRLPLDAVTNKIWYRSLGRTGEMWTKPTIVLEGIDGPPRIAAVGNALHILAGSRLYHTTSTDNGRTWSKKWALIPRDDSVRCRSYKYDAIALDSMLVVAYMGYASRVEGLGRRTELHVMVLNAGRIFASRLIGTYPFDCKAQSQPRLIRTTSGLLLVISANGDGELPPRGNPLSQAIEGRAAGGLLLFRSSDGGITWTAPKPMPPVASNGRNWLPIVEMHPVVSTDRTVMVFNSRGSLHVLALSDSGWVGQARWLEGPSVAYVSSSDSRTFDCYMDSLGGHIAWAIEARPPATTMLEFGPRDLYTKLNTATLKFESSGLQLGEPTTFGSSGELARAVRLAPRASRPVVLWTFERPGLSQLIPSPTAGVSYRYLQN